MCDYCDAGHRLIAKMRLALEATSAELNQLETQPGIDYSPEAVAIFVAAQIAAAGGMRLQVALDYFAVSAGTIMHEPTIGAISQ